MHRALPTVAAAVTLALSGCGDEATTAPAACLAGTGEYLSALGTAPGGVLLDGSTPISECLVDEQGSAELQQVGRAAIEAATTLNAEALRDPGGSATVELGYLIGALQRAAGGTSGIHSELIRRLNTAARFSPDGALQPAEFERAFGRGFAAGQGGG